MEWRGGGLSAQMLPSSLAYVLKSCQLDTMLSLCIYLGPLAVPFLVHCPPCSM